MIIDLKDCVIKIKDGGSNEIEITLGEGTFSYTEQKKREYFKDRGVLDTVRDGDEEPVDVSFDFTWEFIISNSSGAPSVEDVLKKRGEAAAWVSSDTEDPCAPYAVDIEIFHEPAACDGSQNETITLSCFRYESLAHDLKGGKVTVTGKCNVVEATAVAGTNSSST